MFKQATTGAKTDHIKITKEEEEDELDHMSGDDHNGTYQPEPIHLEQADMFKSREIETVSKAIGLTIVDVAPKKYQGQRGKGRKPNKNRGRKCTPAQLEHLRLMRIKSASMSAENKAKRQAKKTAEAKHVADLEAKIEALVKAGRPKKRKSAEEKEAKLMSLLDRYDVRRKKRKAKKTVKFTQATKPQQPHPNRIVPRKHRPLPPPDIHSGPFAGLFGNRQNLRRGWRG